MYFPFFAPAPAVESDCGDEDENDDVVVFLFLVGSMTAVIVLSFGFLVLFSL